MQTNYTDEEYQMAMEDDYDPGELTDERCPDYKECGGYLIKQAVSDGPDDFTFTWTCNKCGLVESE